MKPVITKTTTKKISIECSPKDIKRLVKKCIPKNYVFDYEYEFYSKNGKTTSVLKAYIKTTSKKL